MTKIHIAMFIRELLDSSISSTKIAEESKVDLSSISRLRSGERKIENITVKNAQRLIDVYEKLILNK